MRLMTSALLSVCLLAGPAWAQSRPSKPTMRLDLAPLGVNARTYGWPSGMQMVLGADELSSAVAVTLVVDAGWTSDPAGKAGLMALFERAWWRSEVSPGVTVLDQLVNGYGCTVDSFVEADALRVTGTCPNTSIDAAMAVWGRLLSDPLAGVDEATLSEERARVRSEGSVRASLSSSTIRGWTQAMMPALFPEGHAYHRVPLADLDKVTLADLRAHAAATITPAATTVVVLGGFDDDAIEYGLSLVGANFPPTSLHPDLKPEMMRRFAKEGFDEPDPDDASQWFVQWGDPAEPNKSMRFVDGPEARGKKFSGDPPAPPAAGPFQVVRGLSDDPVILVGWTLPPSLKGNDGEYRVLARLVHSMIAQYLEEPSLERLPGCYVVPGAQASVLTCAGVLKEGQEASAERVARRMVDQLSYITDMGNRAGVDVAVSQGQIGILSNLLWDFDPLGGLWDSRSYWVSTGVHFAGKPNEVAQIVGSVPGVQSEELIKLTTQWITRERSRAIAVLPAEAPRELAVREHRLDLDNRDRSALAASYWDRLATGVAPLPYAAAKVSDARLTAAWDAVPADRVQYSKLGNGLQVLAISQPELPVAEARVVAFNGRVLDPSEFDAYHYAREMMRPSREARAEVPNFGGAPYAWRDDLLQHYGIRHSPVNVEQALWVMRELMATWRVSTTSKTTWLAEEKKQIVDRWYDVVWHADDLAAAHLFAASPIAGDVTWQDMVRWGELSSTDLRDLMLAKWRPDNTMLLYVGPGPVKEMITKAGKHFADWEVEAPSQDKWAPRTPGLAPLPASRQVVLMKREGEFTDVRLSCRLDADPVLRAAAEQLVRRHVGEGWSSVVSRTEAWPGGTSVLQLELRAPSASAGAAVSGLLGQLDALAAGVDDTEARAAAWRGAMGTSLTLSSYALTMARYAGLVGEGADVKAEAERGKQVAAVNGAALTPIAARCASSAYVAVIGEASVGGATAVDWKQRGKDLHAAADPKGFAREQKKGGR